MARAKQNRHEKKQLKEKNEMALEKIKNYLTSEFQIFEVKNPQNIPIDLLNYIVDSLGKVQAKIDSNNVITIELISISGAILTTTNYVWFFETFLANKKAT